MKKMTAVFFIFFVSFTCWTQEKNNAATAAQTVEWVRVQNSTSEFSVELPSNFVYFYDKDGFTYDDFSRSNYLTNMVMLNAAFEKTVMRVEIYKTSAPKKFLEELIDRDRIKGRESKDLPEPADGFTVRQFSQDKFEAFRTKEITEVNFVTRLIASKTFLYIVTVANRGAASAAATRFLSSIRLDQAGSSNTEKIVDLSSLKPVTLDQIAEMAEENTDPKQIQTEKPLEKPENPVIILTKPAATYTEAARAARISGTIRLRLIFGKDGRISKISILKSLPNGLTRNAVMAALRIKFLPQEKENQFETVTKTVEYSFSVG